MQPGPEHHRHTRNLPQQVPLRHLARQPLLGPLGLGWEALGLGRVGELAQEADLAGIPAVDLAGVADTLPELQAAAGTVGIVNFDVLAFNSGTHLRTGEKRRSYDGTR